MKRVALVGVLLSIVCLVSNCSGKKNGSPTNPAPTVSSMTVIASPVAQRHFRHRDDTVGRQSLQPSLVAKTILSLGLSTRGRS